MIITVVNRSRKVADEEVINVIRAINRQIKEDFEPYWSFGATLRLEGAIGNKVNKATLAEMRGDAQGNLLVQGPHPSNPKKEVFHWFEMCDAVQSQTYEIDGIEVSNFVLPLYFTPKEQEGGRNDFLNRPDKNGKRLQSFGVSEGGYVGFYDPQSQAHDTYSAPADKKAQNRMKIKNKYKFGRGYVRKRGKSITSREKEHALVLKQ